MPSHFFYSTVGGQNFTGSGVHVYVPNGTARCM